MAKLSDVPGVVRKIGLKPLAMKVWSEIQEDAVFTWASSLAYSWIFALFPFVIFMLTLVPYLPGQTKDKALQELQPAIQSSVGGDAGQMLLENVKTVMSKTQGGLLSIGLVLALWGASGGMSMTMSAIDKAYEVQSERSFIMHRLVAIGLTVCVVLLVLVALLLMPIGSAILGWMKDHLHLGMVAVIAINIVRYVLALLVLVTSVGLMYYWGPNIKQRWQTVTPGAIFTVAVWLLMGLGFGWYVSSFGKFNETYGTLGAAIILLLFFYVSAAVLLIGAEVNSVIDFAVLGVKPGTRDFTAPAPAEQSGQRKDALSSPSTTEDKVLRAAQDRDDHMMTPTPVPVGKAQEGWWKWAAAGLAAGWLVKSAQGKGAKARFGHA